jgi:probable HAF family extracellular repeat protein
MLLDQIFEPGTPFSVDGISADGLVVYGNVDPPGTSRTPFTWSESTGVVLLPKIPFPDSPDRVWTANGANADVTVVVGGFVQSPIQYAAMWSETHGPSYFFDPEVVDPLPYCGGVGLHGISDDGGTLLGTGVCGSGANRVSEVFVIAGGVLFPRPSLYPDDRFAGARDISADGNVVVGRSGSGTATMWVGGSGPIALPNAPGVPTGSNGVNAVSADGSVAVGHARFVPGSSGGSPARWVAGGLPERLGPVDDSGQTATAVSADGSVIAGVATRPNGDTRGFIWSESSGPRWLREVLEIDYGLDLPSNLAFLGEVVDISADGTVFVGEGSLFGAGGTYWIATIPGVPNQCPSDLDKDGTVNAEDLFELLGSWGDCPGGSDPCTADLTGDGVVNTDDLFDLLGGWGNC